MTARVGLPDFFSCDAGDDCSEYCAEHTEALVLETQISLIPPHQFLVELSKEYLQRGMLVLPVHYKTKECYVKDRSSYEYRATDFLGKVNLGFLLGARSGNLVDIDIDSVETEKLSPFLPETSMIWGRGARRRTHFGFRSDEPMRGRQFVDPIDGGVLIEIRSGGSYTLAPGSVHPTGERYEFDSGDEPTPSLVESNKLSRRVSLIAAAALISRYFPQDGRQRCLLALSGVCAREGLLREEAELLVQMIHIATGDEKELAHRLTVVGSSYKPSRQNEKMTGIPSLAAAFGSEGDKVVRRVFEWLRTESRTTEQGSSASQVGKFSTRTFSVMTDDEDLLVYRERAPSYLGNGVIAEGSIVLVAGEGAVGKTTFNLNLAYHLASGRPFHGFQVPHPLRVVYLEMEGNRDHLRERRKQLRDALGFNSVPNLMWVEQAESIPPIIDPGFRALLEQTRPEVVFLDTIRFFYAGEENSSTAWMNLVVKPLRELCRSLEFKPAFVLSHHLSKKSEMRSGIEKIRGTGAIKDDASTVLMLERKDERICLTFAKIKDGPPVDPRVLSVDWSTGVMTHEQDEVFGVVAEPRIEVVVDILCRAEGEMTTGDLVREVAKECEIGETTAKDLIGKAVRYNKVRKARRGHYAAVREDSVNRSESVETSN